MKVVLVTGASSGIGAACASHLTRSNYKVYGASRRGTTAEGAIPIVMDVSDDSSVQSAVSLILKQEGRIDAVVNNAGIAIAGALEDATILDAKEQFEVNLFGVLRVCRAVLPAMRQPRSGHIITIGSIGGVVAIPYQGLYSASKFALEGLSESLRMEVRDFGVRVVIIEPGDHRTELTQNRKSVASNVYRAQFDRAIGRMASDELSGRGPEGVGRLVHRVLQKQNPRLRYTVGPPMERAVIWLKRMAPYAIVEKAMRIYYGI